MSGEAESSGGSVISEESVYSVGDGAVDVIEAIKGDIASVGDSSEGWSVAGWGENYDEGEYVVVGDLESGVGEIIDV